MSYICDRVSVLHVLTLVTCITSVVGSLNGPAGTNDISSPCTYHSNTLTLDCTAKGLTQVPDLVINSKVRELYLNKNSLADLSTSQFESLTSLVKLDLSSNRIVSSTTDADVFAHMTHLEKLVLSNNNLGPIIMPGLLDTLTNLKILYLDNCGIEFIHDKYFRNLSSLQYLDLSSNRLTHIGTPVLDGLKSLRHLSLHHNLLSVYPHHALQALPILTLLDLRFNKIKRIPISAAVSHHLVSFSIDANVVKEIHPLAFINATSLQHLSVSDNQLSMWPEQALQYLRNLRELDVSQNSFHYIPPMAVSNLNRLQQVKLVNCPRLKRIGDFAFKDCRELEFINLSFNKRLRDISPTAFDGSVNLKKLLLRGNALRTIPEDLLPWYELDELDLSSNPWNCSCELRWLPGVLRLPSSRVHTYSRLTTCSTPPALSGRVISELNDKIMSCQTLDHSRRIMIAAVSAAVVAVILSALCLAYYCRHKIVDKVRKKFHYRRHDANNVDANDEVVTELNTVTHA